MPHPGKPNMSSDQNPKPGKDNEYCDDAPSNNLWVGNLSLDATDSDLMGIFGKFGAMDCITTYAARSFAFVYFKAVEDAKAAKDALQGTLFLGSPIKIEFARPAKPGKQVWVGAIGSSVTKELLENEFVKFGKLDDFRFFRERNTAIVDYYKLEDAVAAVENMNGKHLCGQAIRVDYLRSQPPRRDTFDFRDSRDGHFNSRRNVGPPNSIWSHASPQSMGVRRVESQPSNVLWIGYPPSIQIDEQMLHNAMILFGEIERIKSFPSRHYSFVEFRSVDEARRAKEGLQGRLFNDPRIHIMFSSSDFTAGKDAPPFFPGMGGPRPDMFFNEPSFGPGPMEMLSLSQPNNFPAAPNGIPGPNMFMRPFGPQGFDLSLAATEPFNDFNNPIAPNWRRISPSAPGMLPPAPGMLPPAPGMQQPLIRPMWDGFGVNPAQRDPKRSRVDGPPPLDNRGGGEAFGLGNVQIQIHRSPLLARAPSSDRPTHHADNQGPPDIDYCWRGVIAKGGTTVCNARCIPIGKGIDSQLPEIVNCSARTGLDLLTKHYAEASGFDIVYFLPDSEEDFASYTEFLRYLGAKNRAGVAKFDDGTTLFLVPPSEFLSKVLNVMGPERLYGVVLKLSQQQTQHPVPSLPPQFMDRPLLPPTPQNDYNLVSQREDNQVMQMEYNNRVLQDETTSHAGSTKPLLANPDESRATQSGPTDYGGGPGGNPPPQAGVSLTPELIASLASLVPDNVQSHASASAQLPMGSSLRPAMASQSQEWRQEDPTNNPPQQFGHHYNNQAPLLSQFQSYPNVGNGQHPTQAMFGGPQVQDPSLNMQQVTAAPPRPANTFGGPSHGAQFSVPQQANQQYQLEASQNPHFSGMPGFFHAPVSQQPQPTAASSGGNVQQMGVSYVADKPTIEFPNQVQQLQSALSGSGQGQLDSEADKNQRYQSTLQFAASLLLQIQQQQQSNAQPVQGSNNQQ